MSVSSKRKPPRWRHSKNKAKEGEIDLFYLDESGFAPTLPVGYTWAKEKTRPTVAYEAPQGRRVNVIGAYAPFQTEGERFLYETRGRADGPLNAEVYLSFVRRVAGLDRFPAAKRKCVIVQDNYSVHVCRPVQEERKALEENGVTLFQLPGYSPKMNRIEPIWRQIKYHDLPKRSFPTETNLKEAVDQALKRRALLLLPLQDTSQRA